VPEESTASEGASSRPFWSGTISFGLVSVPVNLLPATRSDGTPMRMVTEDGTPLSRRYFAPRDKRELSNDDIVRGYAVGENKYVVVDDDELERLAPERTRDIDLRSIVKASDIDPIYFERAYYLTPAGASTKAYRLLAKVMGESDRAGIATFVMRGKEYLVAILAEDGILRAETLRFADEVRAPGEIGLPEPKKVAAAQLKRFEAAIEKLKATRLSTKLLEDDESSRLLALAERKAKAGKDVHRKPAQEDRGTEVIDLMEMLRRSLRGSEAADETEDRSRSRRSLADRPKADLYEEARSLDIPGRSGMTKNELIAAIERSA